MQQNYTNEWLEMEIKGYKFYTNNGYLDTARWQKQRILGITEMTEQEFEELVKAC